MHELFEAIGNYEFMQRALLAGPFIAVCCAVLGVFLVLRRLSMIGDGLSHVAFGTVGVALAFGWSPLYVSIPGVMLCSLGVLKLSERAKMRGDAAIGLVAALGLAVGVLFASKGGGFNVDLFSYLFGNILSISRAEVWLSIVLSVVIVSIVVLFYHDLFAVTFDPDFAAVLGARSRPVNRLLVLCTAATVVLGIRLVGAMLISSLIIFPAVSALQWSRGFKATIALAVCQGVLSVLAGIALSFVFDLPSGATIVLVNAGCFGVMYCLGLLMDRR